MKEIIKNWRKYYLCFMLYAVFGWCYEVFLEVVVYQWGYSDRGVLTGPYCPVYGVGALAFIIVIYPLIRNREFRKRLLYIPLVFLGCMAIATGIELVTSYICELAMGSWPWQTYADYKYNFQARIALSPSLRFGLGGVIFLYVLQPFFEFIIGKLGEKNLKTVSTIVLVIFIADIVWMILKLVM